MVTVLKPPTAFASVLSPVIFLAGAIDMGAAVDWQAAAAEHLGDKAVTLLNPRRDDWNSDWEQSIDHPEFRAQVEWELDGLDRCDAIALYFPSESTSPISLLELGLFASSGKVFVCCEPGFWRKGNVDIVCERYGVTTTQSLDELLDAACAFARV